MNGSAACYAGITDSINELSDSIENINNAVAGIRAFVDRLSVFLSFAGYQSVIVFTLVMLLSVGFSAIGLPRGIATFLLSLAVIDALWILWKTSFSEGFSQYMPSIIKVNAFVLAPIGVFYAFMRGLPFIAGSIKKIIQKRKAGGSFSKSELLTLNDEMLRGAAALAGSVMEDISESKDRETIILTNKTTEAAERMKRICEQISMQKTGLKHEL
jgi:hypothetical protein